MPSSFNVLVFTTYVGGAIGEKFAQKAVDEESIFENG